MIRFIEGLNEDILGIEAVGQVTHEDYRDILSPTVSKLLEKGPLRLLYVVGPEFTGYQPRAIVDDTTLGLKHWQEFPFVALVTDVDWIQNSVRMFKPFFPGEVRLFPLSELESAKAWILNPQAPAKV